jgi:opacity protein-like surface antigen
MRISALASAAALGFAAIMISPPVRAADIEVPQEAVAATNAWYASLHGGVKFGEDWDDDFSLFCDYHCPIDLDVTAETDNGWRIGGSLGFMLSNVFAIEGELSYMNQDFDEFTINKITIKDYSFDCDHEWCSQDLDGDASIITGMVNLIAGVPIGSILRPNIGIGVGVAHVALDDVADGFLDDGDTAFAAQAFAGLDFIVTSSAALGVRGRVLHINDLEFEDEWDCDHDVDVDLIKSVEAVLSFTW